MKIGFCGKPDMIGQVAEAEFDYIEMPVSYIAGLSEDEFSACLKAVKEAPIPVPSFNVLFPGDIALMDEGEDERIEAYLRGALSRVRSLGGKTVVFGSGRSRNRPESMTYNAAFRRLIDVTRIIGRIAAEYDITVVIEPLNRGECNMINSLGEGACLVSAADCPNVKLLADYYHIEKEGQPPEDIERLTGIAHAHIAAPAGRRVPTEAEEGFEKMFSAMKKTGYQGLISVEGGSDDLLSDGPKAVKMLKELWEKA